MFAQLLLQAISAVVSAQLTLLIQKHKEIHGEVRNNQLKEAIKNSFLLLQQVTDKTKTKIDDTAVIMILNAVEQAN